jgi:taurine transport system substrate-binding protein
MKETAGVLITSGDLSNWGKATFDAMVAPKGFTDENPEFTCQWVKMVSSADADYRANPSAYGPGTDNAMGIANAVSGDEAQVGGVLALYDYPTLEQQVSGTWLGGGVQNALMAASEFLTSQGKLDNVLDSYAGSATPKFAQTVLDGDC